MPQEDLGHTCHAVFQINCRFTHLVIQRRSCDPKHPINLISGHFKEHVITQTDSTLAYENTLEF